MTRPDEIGFVLHGLRADNGQVRAAVFANKLRLLVGALSLADRIANGGTGHQYMIANLSQGSAAVRVREKVKILKRSHNSGISLVEETANAIYTRKIRSDIPEKLMQKVGDLSLGVDTQFSHAELAFSDENIIRIDNFLSKQRDSIIKEYPGINLNVDKKFYQGIAIGSFDGVLKEIDGRGTMLRGALVLAAGGNEIECIMNKERIPEVRECFYKRVIIEGFAHYDASRALPVRIDVNNIKIVKTEFDLCRWRGAFRVTISEETEEDW